MEIRAFMIWMHNKRIRLKSTESEVLVFMEIVNPLHIR